MLKFNFTGPFPSTSKWTKTLSVKGKINYQETEGEKVATGTVLSSVLVGFREPRAGFGWVAWLEGAHE